MRVLDRAFWNRAGLAEGWWRPNRTAGARTDDFDEGADCVVHQDVDRKSQHHDDLRLPRLIGTILLVLEAFLMSSAAGGAERGWLDLPAEVPVVAISGSDGSPIYRPVARYTYCTSATR